MLAAWVEYLALKCAEIQAGMLRFAILTGIPYQAGMLRLAILTGILHQAGHSDDNFLSVMQVQGNHSCTTVSRCHVTYNLKHGVSVDAPDVPAQKKSQVIRS